MRVVLARDLVPVAVGIAEDLNERRSNARATAAEVRLMGVVVASQGRAIEATARKLEELRQRLPRDALFQDTDPNFAQIKVFAQRRAAIEALDILRADAEAGRIPVRQFLAIVRTTAKDSFQRFVLPALRREFVTL
jgi:hypothetical protein